jgi:hypothetical protein
LAIPESSPLPKTIASIESAPPVRAELAKRSALRG